MKQLLAAALLLTSLSPLAIAGGVHDMKGMDMPGMSHAGHGATEEAKKDALGLHIMPVQLKVGQASNLVMHLTKDGKPLGTSGLQTVHTKKFHLLVIDESLSDYHHLHPTETETSGEFKASFKPALSHPYMVWADVTPEGGNQQYVRTTLKPEGKLVSAKVDTRTSLKAVAEGMTFDLKFDETPKAGAMSMATITVTDSNGKPFNQLQPVMGAFAHVVGFSQDGSSIAHVHPQGPEPTKDSERSGPAISFHFEPEKTGFTKLFAQFKIKDKDVFVPFGVTIN